MGKALLSAAGLLGALLIASSTLPGCYSSYGSDGGITPPGADGGRDAAPPDTAPPPPDTAPPPPDMPPPPPPDMPPPPDGLVEEACRMICDSAAACFGEPPDASCNADCISSTAAFPHPECAHMWFEFAACVEAHSCEIFEEEDLLFLLCGPPLEFLEAECGLSFGGGGMSGGGSSGSAGEPDEP